MEPDFLGELDAGANETGVVEPSAPETPQPEAPSEAVVESPPAEDASAQEAQGKEDPKPQANGADKQATVPLAALHEAREQVKQLRTKLAELEAQPRLTPEDAALLKQLREANAAQAKKEAEPDFLADPKGYVDSKVSAALKQLEETGKDAKETKEQLQQQQQRQAIIAAASEAEAEFAKNAPDYQQALTHARNVRIQQLQLMYPQATEQQIRQQVGSEEIAIAAHVLQQGGNPAQWIYQYAQTVGYQKPAPSTQQQTKPAAKPDKDAARTLGSGGGDAAPDADDSDDPNSEFLAVQNDLLARFKRK